LLLTCGALLVHGYHPGADDAEIYIPGIKKLLNPSLYPFGDEFFQSHARMTVFPHLVAWSVRLTHLPFDVVIFLWHVACLFLFLLACWRLSRLCFEDPRARWGGVVLVAALLTLPVSGTALNIMDPYFTARSISAFGVVFPIADVLEKKYVRACFWIVLTAAVHPLMAVFGFSFLVLLVGMRKFAPVGAPAALLLPFGLTLKRPSDAYLEAVQTRSYFFLLHWPWYAWVGILAPLVLFWWFGRMARRNRLATLELLSRTLIVFGGIYFVAGLVLTVPERFVGLTFLQPMRSLMIEYVLLFLFIGGFLGQWVLKNRIWLWMVIFAPLCAGMWYAQRADFPADRHVEWPGVATKNRWVEAFLWIRQNTPQDAIFALDPKHMEIPDEGLQGFRAIAERSMLADAWKDAGACTMFPQSPMAEHWREQVNATRGWSGFTVEDLRRLKQSFGVSWVVLERSGISDLTCPYQNDRVMVCRVNEQ